MNPYDPINNQLVQQAELGQQEIQEEGNRLTKDQLNKINAILINCSSYTVENIKEKILSILSPPYLKQDLSSSSTFDVMKNILFPSFNIKKEMSNLSQVCKYWKNDIVTEACIKQLETTTSLSMQELAIYQKRLKLEPNDWEGIFIHCKNLESLSFDPKETSLKQMKSLDEDEARSYARNILLIMEVASRHCPNLTSLDLSNCLSSRNTNLLNSAAKYFPKLAHLNLAHWNYQPVKLGIEKLMKKCGHNLISLNYSSNDVPVGDDIIKIIAGNCPKLERFNVSTLANYSECPVTDNSIISLAAGCPSLTHLYLSNSHITNKSLEALAEGCKKLVFFHHYGCSNFTDENVENLKMKLSNLEASTSLDLAYTQQKRDRKAEIRKEIKRVESLLALPRLIDRDYFENNLLELKKDLNT